MNVDLDKYVRNFRIFYSKVVSGHPQQANLQKKFKFLLQNQANKWRNSLFANNKQYSANSIKSFLSKAKSMQPKSQGKKNVYQWLFETNNFSRCFVFVCIMSLLQAKSKQGLQMIRAHLQNEGALADGKMFKGIQFRKIIYGWTKIQKLFLNTFNSKPHIYLGECLNDFPEEFIDVLYNVFVDRKVPKLFVGEITDDKLSKLIDTIKINLTYFEFQNDHINLMRKCGNFKKNVNIGYLTDQKVYVVAKQLPRKQKQDIERKTLIKLSKISTDLFKMYQNTDVKLRNLECIIATKSKLPRPIGLQAPPKMGSSFRKGSLIMSKSRI